MRSGSHPRDRVFVLASLLFLFSGAAGLAYEVIWFKRFSHIWGNSTLAMAAVVASFLFGLGVGARLLGRLADRVGSPLLWYGIAETAIGLLALAIPFELELLLPMAASLYQRLLPYPLIHSLARFGFTFAVIGPPCVLMGGTLPLLISHFTPAGSALKRATAWLYAINTLGAAIGCTLTGFYLLPVFGLTSTNHGAAALNLAIGLVAVVVAGATPARATWGPAAMTSSDADREAPATFSRWLVFPTAVLTGGAALVLQVAWTRQLTLILGGSTYAFTAVLLIILVGIGIGSLICHLFLRDSEHLLYLPALAVLFTSFFTWLGQLAIPWLVYIAGAAVPLRFSHALSGALAAGLSAVLELGPAVGMGVLFPLLAQVTRRAGSDSGTLVGDLYAWNTLGTILGATLTPLLLIPRWGTAQAISFALALYALAAVILFPWSGLRDWLGRGLIGALATGVAWLSVGGWTLDPKILNSGMYLYGYFPPETIESRKTLFYDEGPSCNVIVVQHPDGVRSLSVNGKVDASTQTDMIMQLGTAYLPRFLLPQARDVLVIGFGSGTTAGASLLFPDTRVVCSEIEPAVLAASEQFAAVNHRPQDSPRFSIVLDDGRSHLQGTSDQYDLILSEPSNPWIAGVSNLFTKEFYEIAKLRLKPNGILAQWIQNYDLDPSDYAMILRTLMSVFPHSGLLRLGANDTAVLASSSPLTGTKDSIAAAQALVDSLPEAKADLTKYFGSSNVLEVLLVAYVLDEDGLAKLAHRDGAQVINTDLNMRLEFDAPRRLHQKAENALATVYGQITATMNPEWFERSFERWGGSRDQVGFLRQIAFDFVRLSRSEEAARLIDAGLRLDPDQPGLLGDKLRLNPPNDPAAVSGMISTIAKSSWPDANQVAHTLGQAGRFDLAAALYERIVEAHPDSVTTWTNLGIVYRAQGQLDRAEDALRKALALDPFFPTAVSTLAQLQLAAATARVQ